MKKLSVCLLVVAFLLAPVVVFAGVTGKIAGKVIDKDTRDPLPGVNITIQGTTMGAATNLNGEYFIINIPPGTYSVTASMVGYNSLSLTDVRVRVDLTTPVDFALDQTIIEFEAVTVTSERPMIQKDMTATTKIYDSEEIENVALDEVEEAVTLTAGAVDEGGEMHIRGGRSREVVYMIDGMQVEDPSFGGFDTDVPEMAVEEISVVTGGFDAEYGSAQSGLVNLVTKEGGAKFGGRLKFKTTIMDENADYFYWNDPNPLESDYTGVTVGDGEQLKDYEFSLSGPEPITTYLLPNIPGQMKFFLAGEIMSDRGRFPHQHSKPYTFQGKLTYKPDANHKIAIGGLSFQNDFEVYSNEWRRTTYEDLNYMYRNETDPFYIEGWYGNGQLDDEDLNHNNVLNDGSDLLHPLLDEAVDGIDYNNDGDMEDFINEDLNGNGNIDSEDLNYNGGLDAFNMLDHLPFYERNSNQLNVSWTHTLNPSTFYEVRLSRYYTSQLRQTQERINEDRDGDGKLDIGEDINRNGILDPGEDIDGDGALDLSEDLNNDGNFQPWNGEDIDNDGFFDSNFEDWNGNLTLDPYNESTDLLRDENRNGIVDASEERFPNNPELWLSWEKAIQAVTAGVKSQDYYIYSGPGGLSFSRENWREDEQATYSARIDFTSQVDPHNQVKVGFEGTYYDVMYYRSTDRYGYAWNYRVFPSKGGFYIQDKMEYEGMVLKAGLRFDYFNPNASFAKSETDPVWDKTDSDYYGEVPWVDEDGDGVHDVYGTEVGDVKFPEKADAKSFWEPRLGVSFPITERDLLFFNYGRFFQVPLLSYTHININYNMGGGYPVVGNPNLEPEKTTTYELGVKHQFTDTFLLRATGFYKDITGLINTKLVPRDPLNTYGYYFNSDYGSVRGFELSLEKRYGHYTSGLFNYTYSIGKGKASDANSGYITNWGGNIIPRVEQYLSWDQRHTISANISFAVPDKENLFGVPVLDDTRLNIIYTYGSGTRYTKPRQTKLWPEYTETMPYTMNTTLTLSKYFNVGRFRPSLFFEVINLFNKKNVIRLADEAWYHRFTEMREVREEEMKSGEWTDVEEAEYWELMDSDGDGKVDENKEHPEMGELLDRSVYGPMRTMRVGFRLEF